MRPASTRSAPPQAGQGAFCHQIQHVGYSVAAAAPCVGVQEAGRAARTLLGPEGDVAAGAVGEGPEAVRHGGLRPFGPRGERRLAALLGVLRNGPT